MDTLGNFIRGLIILLVGVSLFSWILYRWLRSTREDPGRLILKWILTALIIIFLLIPLGRNLTTNGPGGAFLVPFVAVGGVLLAIIWTSSITGWFGEQVESLFTGGNRSCDPEPVYSQAQSLRKRGHYQEAAEAVQGQLEMFPEDVTGHILLAEIQAEDFKDMDAAQATIESFCEQPDHTPQHIWYALDTLAEWHLKYDQNVPAAIQCIQSIIDRFPDTPQAAQAAQKLAHMPSAESLAKAHDTTPIPMKEGVRHIGLLKDSSHLKAKEKDLDEVVANLAGQLELHPQDTEARENLASLYASHYQDLDLAREQIEILINLPNQSHKNKVRWLNLMADFQASLKPEFEAMQGILQRIVDLNPGVASATMAQQRMAYLRLELKGKEKSQAIRLGSDSVENSDGKT